MRGKRREREERERESGQVDCWEQSGVLPDAAEDLGVHFREGGPNKNEYMNKRKELKGRELLEESLQSSKAARV